MTRYIASVENLQLIMNTLRDKSKNIQFEAFHVFKVCRFSFFHRIPLPHIDQTVIQYVLREQIFVANPHKPPAVASILRKNKDRLLAYLTEFHKDRDGKILVFSPEDMLNTFLFPPLLSRSTIQRECTSSMYLYSSFGAYLSST